MEWRVRRVACRVRSHQPALRRGLIQSVEHVGVEGLGLVLDADGVDLVHLELVLDRRGQTCAGLPWDRPVGARGERRELRIKVSYERDS